MKATFSITAALLVLAIIAHGAQGARVVDTWAKDLESHTFRALLTASPKTLPPGKPANVAGEWSVFFETPQENTVTMTLVQNESKLTGRVTMESGEIPIAGRVDGNEVKILWTVYEGGERIDLAFIGTFEREEITGVARSNLGEGELHAQRTSGPPR
jgi:hypothetical protein